jgi:hypothetical protein
MLFKIPLNHFDQIVLLVHTLFMSSFFFECNISNLWIHEVMEFLLLSFPYFMVREISIFLLV